MLYACQSREACIVTIQSPYYLPGTLLICKYRLKQQHLEANLYVWISEMEENGFKRLDNLTKIISCQVGAGKQTQTHLIPKLPFCPLYHSAHFRKL